MTVKLTAQERAKQRWLGRSFSAESSQQTQLDPMLVAKEQLAAAQQDLAQANLNIADTNRLLQQYQLERQIELEQDAAQKSTTRAVIVILLIIAIVMYFAI